MRRNLIGTFPGLWLAVVILASLAAPFLARASPLQPIADPLTPPSSHAPLGTDALGRDLWARLIYGGRVSLGASFLALALTIVVGGVAGMAAALAGGWSDRVIVWGANSALAIPGLLLALLLVAAVGPGVPALVVAVGLGGAPGFTRLTRSVFLQVKQDGFVTAAAAMGADLSWIASRHVLPNAQPQLLSLVATHFAWALMGVITLSFLGLGGDPTIPEWGAMLNAGRADLVGAPWAALWPALAICLTVLSVHALAHRIGSPTRS